ncbi:MAG: SIR2 family protein [Luteimonas sp.]
MEDIAMNFDGFDPSSSILFLGSGFSMGAENIAHKSPPNGSGLKRHFIQQLGLPEDTAYDLQILTEEFAEADAQKLRDELYKIFRVTKLSDAQKTILGKSWRRIYTTNYDDVVESYRLSIKASPSAFDVSEAVPNKLPHGAVIHLHGSIRLVTAENLRESLILGEASYVNQYVTRSPWYDQFQRDMAFAKAIYIVGYSLADYHIAALLMADPSLSGRTTFIQPPTPDPIFFRRTYQYGRTAFIGVEGFAGVVSKAPTGVTPSIGNLRSFRSLAPTRDKHSSARPTATEVYDLLVYGNFDPARLARAQPAEDYAIARSDRVQTAADVIEQKSALVVDGRLGNGKTIFLHLLAFELSARGWRCFLFKPGHPDIAQEIAALTNVEQLVVFVDQYSAAQDSLKGLREALPGARIVVEVRSGTFEVRFHELNSLLPKPFDRISLNGMSRSEHSAFRQLCDSAGLSSPERSSSADLRDILLDVFKNKAIKERVRGALSPLFADRTTRRVLVMTMLIAAHQGAVSTAFIRSVVGEDPFTALKPMENLSSEIFEVSADGFRARSAIFSSFVVNEFVEVSEISDAIVEVTLAAAARRSDRPYRVLMSNMMAYSNLHRMLGEKGDANPIIIGIYERLRYDERVNEEPLYWLQYAIVMAELPRLDAAEQFIETAYRKAAKLSGFQTYQIDTQAFRIALMRAINEPSGQPVSNIDRIVFGVQQIDSMLADASHRAYAVRVLEGMFGFVSARINDLTKSERTAVQFWLQKVAKSLEFLPDDFKMMSESEAVKRQIQAAAALFLS